MLAALPHTIAGIAFALAMASLCHDLRRLPAIARALRAALEH